jgi:hypothetical protein
MFDFVGLKDGADPIRAVGAKLGALADRLEAVNATAAADIAAREASAPWGADEAGMTFLTSYNDKGLSTALKTGLTTGANELHRLSDGVVKTMDAMELTDTNSAADINTLKAP